MKTYTICSQKIYIYSLFGFLLLLFSSCATTQNTGAYDSDGVYYNSSATKQVATQESGYQTYFNSLQEKEEEVPETFVDVNDYNSNYPQNQEGQAYPSWGTTYSDVNYYDNTWSVGFGFGWGYPYYGYGWGYPYYGWGYPYYGWGYPGYGWGYPGCVYPGYGYGYNNYSYATGRRGSTYGSINSNHDYYYNYPSGRKSTTNYSRTSTSNTSVRNNTSTRNPAYNTNNISRTNNNNSSNVTRSDNTTRSSNTRSDNSTRSNSNYSTNSPSRSTSSPSNSGTYSGGRSSSSGGGSYGGGGGGGRSSGGGGRR